MVIAVLVRKPLKRAVLFVSMVMLSACVEKLWNLYPDTNWRFDDAVFVERAESRRSPKIKIFEHLDRGVIRKSGGSRWNVVSAAKMVITPPGRIKIGVVYPGWLPRYFSEKGPEMKNVPEFSKDERYYPEVEFTASASRRYWVTWICVDYPQVAIADADTLQIIAIDSICPDCDVYLGQPLSKENECYW